MINTISGAQASAVIYSLVETARANNLHIYHYFEYLLEELPKLKEFTSAEEESQVMDRLLPWSEALRNNATNGAAEKRSLLLPGYSLFTIYEGYDIDDRTQSAEEQI